MSDIRFDLLNDDGRAAGEVVSEEEVHGQGLWHRGINLCITDRKGGVLQVRRGVPPYVHILPDLWDFAITGHIEAGELPKDAVVRELRQMLRIALPLASLQRMGLTAAGKTRSEYWVEDDHYPADGYWHRVVEYNYVLPMPLLDLASLQLDPNEIPEVKWARIGEIRENLKYPGTLRHFKYAERGPESVKFYGMMLDEAQKKTIRHAGR